VKTKVTRVTRVTRTVVTARAAISLPLRSALFDFTYLFSVIQFILLSTQRGRHLLYLQSHVRTDLRSFRTDYMTGETCYRRFGVPGLPCF
jgi:hypothetical protein